MKINIIHTLFGSFAIFACKCAPFEKVDKKIHQACSLNRISFNAFIQIMNFGKICILK